MRGLNVGDLLVRGRCDASSCASASRRVGAAPVEELVRAVLSGVGVEAAWGGETIARTARACDSDVSSPPEGRAARWANFLRKEGKPGI